MQLFNLLSQSHSHSKGQMKRKKKTKRKAKNRSRNREKSPIDSSVFSSQMYFVTSLSCPCSLSTLATLLSSPFQLYRISSSTCYMYLNSCRLFFSFKIYSLTHSHHMYSCTSMCLWIHFHMPLYR